jgi:Pyridoxamine 5'-phosphate oxidase
MGAEYREIDEGLGDFICQQRIFFVASAPLAEDGHVNVSPKGLDSLRILGPREVAYLDLTGSGIETVAHLRENGRLTLMFCAFQGRPRIVRLQGRGRIVEPEDADWNRLIDFFPPYFSRRSVVLLNVARVDDSCGYGVPLFQYVGERTQLVDWADRKGPGRHCRIQIQEESAEHRQASSAQNGRPEPIADQFLYNYLAFLGR